MLKDILNLGHIVITIDNLEVSYKNIKNELLDLVDNCYLAPCMAMADDTQLDLARKKGIWLEIIFNELQSYKDFEFEKLLINLYPKHDFLVMHRYIDDKYQGKSITVNLSYKTTELFKNIKKLSEGINNEK